MLWSWYGFEKNDTLLLSMSCKPLFFLFFALRTHCQKLVGAKAPAVAILPLPLYLIPRVACLKILDVVILDKLFKIISYILLLFYDYLRNTIKYNWCHLYKMSSFWTGGKISMKFLKISTNENLLLNNSFGGTCVY